MKNKLLLLLILLTGFYTNRNIFAQTIAGYTFLSYQKGVCDNGSISKCAAYPDCVYPCSSYESYSQTYNFLSNYSTLEVDMAVFFNCCSDQYLLGHHTENINLNNIVRGKWVYDSYSLHMSDADNCDCLGKFSYKYYKRPNTPSGFSVEAGYSNVFNEFDTVYFSVNEYYSIILCRQIDGGVWETLDTLRAFDNKFKFVLDDLNGVTNSIQINYKLKTINPFGDDDIKTSLNYCTDLVTYVYPRRPIIDSISSTPQE